jgi:hypothetical protein
LLFLFLFLVWYSSPTQQSFKVMFLPFFLHYSRVRVGHPKLKFVPFSPEISSPERFCPRALSINFNLSFTLDS